MPPATPPSGTTVVASAEPHPEEHPLVATAPAIRHAPATDIPDDLRQDIEAFKEQIKEGRGGKSPPKASSRPEVPLRESRLPKEVQERLPSYLLTVHLYDADPAKRLVIIDGRRLRQGDTTRSGILVEEIFPDGVALAFDGHRFFQPR
jgi:general secretion pathway protein B